ncbi:MAG TPA: DegT/DnrJ/EryC1/StrS aminotransferase family protein [Candidatus Acidoferrales bacterium]|nr:DegT/DnrJ/EryC1/StrS aminotransferase family protein [Candidatus Acidoferrales bacterium]
MERDERLAIEGGRAVRPDFLVFGAPLIGEAEIDEVVDTLRSGWIGFGPKCLRFEEDFAAYVRAPHALSVNSATAALHLALIAAGVGQGDEVVTTPLTFCATANVITHVGAKPVFVDVEQDTQNLDVSRIESAITPRTKAILPVHMCGWPCDMDAIAAIAGRHGLAVIEDAAHATEAWYRGRKVGSLSAFTAFSFYATKNMTTAEGGMLTVADDAAHARLRALRLHGLDKDAWKRYSPGEFLPYETLEPGFKYNMTDLQASLGLHQLARLEGNLERRREIWRTYDEAFAPLPGLRTPGLREAHGTRHARHLYTLRLEPGELAITRTEFARALGAENIGSGIHFVPVHLHAWYARELGTRRGDFPVAEAIGDSTISLPLSPAMNDEDVQDVIAAVRKIVNRHLRHGDRVAVDWDDDALEAA